MRFKEYILSENPMGMSAGGLGGAPTGGLGDAPASMGAAPAGMPSGMGGDMMGGMGAAPAGMPSGMGGDMMGGMGAAPMGAQPPSPPIIPKNADVWDVLDSILNQKPLQHDKDLEKSQKQSQGSQEDQSPMPPGMPQDPQQSILQGSNSSLAG